MMRNTCLFPFYEYIFKYWIQPGKEIPVYDANFIKSKFDDSDLEMEKRKKDIWNKTRYIFELNDISAQLEYLNQLKKSKVNCKLCVTCISCETFFGKKLSIFFLKIRED